MQELVFVNMLVLIQTTTKKLHKFADFKTGV